MLRVESVSAFYGAIQALRNVSLHVNPGEMVALLGANGAGKTTLMKVISGLHPLSKGRLLFNGQGIAGTGLDVLSVMPVTVIGPDGTGRDSDIINGVVYAVDHGVDVILMGANYKLAGLAGIPALTIPTGQAVDQNGKPGQPTGVFITGPYLSDGQVLAVGYALEQALNVQLQPDLDATIQQIEAVTAQ